MNRERLVAALFALLVGVPGTARSAGPSTWSHWARVEVAEPDLYELKLSTEVLGAARGDLADLRVLDPDGMEVPFVVDRPEPEPARKSPAQNLRSELSTRQTVLSLQTGTTLPIHALSLETPEPEFIKAATLEASSDGANFRVLARGVPLFRQNGSQNLTINFPLAPWSHLKVSVDDERGEPIAWTGATVHESAAADTNIEPVEASIRSRDDTRDSTRFSLDLGAAHLTLAALEIVTPDVLFQRRVSLKEAELGEEGISERELHSGFIYAAPGSDDGSSRRTTVSVERALTKRELIVVIHNGDSPPLKVTSIRATRRPVLVRFQVRDAGVHRLFLGNPKAGAPNYDLGGLSSRVKGASAQPAKLGALLPNPDFEKPEPLPDLAEVGAEIDVSKWRYRKAITLVPGDRTVHALELDLDVLSHAAPDFSDLRLEFDGRQVPYVIEHPSLTRAVEPQVAVERDEKRPSISMWRLQLSHSNLPIVALECHPVSPLFRRDVVLFEQLSDGRGGKYSRTLGSATWSRTSETKDSTVVVYLNDGPRSDAMTLETDNGDNPPLELRDCRVSHRAHRVVFKTRKTPTLHYGNPKANRPRYDLSLVAGELLAAERTKASAGPEEDVGKKAPFDGEDVMAVEGWIFWAILALVMVGLLLVIRKLLPKPPDGP